MIIALLAGCGGNAAVPECDALRGLVDKLAACPKVAGKLDGVKAQVDALLGGRMPEGIGETCRAQAAQLAAVWTPIAPDCVR